MQEYDVIVVGAGFAGPVAAKKCAEAGLRTLIVERAQRPGEKVMTGGGVLSTAFLLGPSWLKQGPLERPYYSVTHNFVSRGEVVFQETLSFPVPLAYGVYCRPFCTWEAEQAVKAGAELRTSTTAVDVIKEEGYVKGIITDDGERLKCRVLIDGEGSEPLLAIKAGIRKKYMPQAVELYLGYDFRMPSVDIEKVTGGGPQFYWAVPEDKIMAPPGQGTMGVYVWPYRESVRPQFGQFLTLTGKKAVAEGYRLIETYSQNFFKTKIWRESYEPKVTLRAKQWTTAPMYAPLFDEMYEMPTYGNGILIVGDAGGFETGFGNGIDTAWATADLAADTAIAAIKAGDTSASILRSYELQWKEHPLINLVGLRNRARWNLQGSGGTLPDLIKAVIENITGEVCRWMSGMGAMDLDALRSMLPLL